MPRTAAIACLLLGPALTGCDDELFSHGYQAPAPTLNDVLHIVDHNCISCHAGVTAAGGLDLSTNFCESVLDGRIIVPNSPDFSVLYQRMVSPSDGMPPDGRLPDAQIETVEGWILSGAPCNGVEPAAVGGADTGVSSPGEGIYIQSCAGCHGRAGEGASGPAMASVIPGMTVDEIASVAMVGSGNMPGILARQDEATAVAEYLVETFGG